MTIAGLLLLISDVPSDAARRVARGSSYDGTWSVAIYTLRGDCGSLRAALRIIGGRVYSGDGSYQAYGAVGAGGAIRVTLIRGSQSASGSGRMRVEVDSDIKISAKTVGELRQVSVPPENLAITTPQERYSESVVRVSKVNIATRTSPKS